MGRASASLRVPGLASDAEALWYDPVRWPAWIDGFGHVVDLPDTWPASGRLAWNGVAQGRGRVLETVIAYEPRGGQTRRGRGQPPARHPAGRLHARPRQRRRHALARVRAQGAQPAHPADRPAVHPPRDRRVAAPDARALRPRAARRCGVGGRDQPLGSTPMFVFKAAVVGAGVMGGEIAQVIAAADIPVVLKDVDAEVRRRRARQGARGHPGPGRQARQEGQARPRSRPRPQAERILANITGATDYDGFGDVDFVDRGRAREDGDQARGVRRARRGHARPRDPRLQHLGPVDHRDRATPRSGPTRSSASTSSGPRPTCG